MTAQINGVGAAAGVDVRRNGRAREIYRVVASLRINRQAFHTGIVHSLRAECHRTAGDFDCVIASRAVGNERIRAATTTVADCRRERAAALEINVVSVIAAFAVQRQRARAGPAVDRQSVRSRTPVKGRGVDALQRHRSVRAIGCRDDIAVHR